MLNVQASRQKGCWLNVKTGSITELKTILVLLFMSGLLTMVKRHLMNWNLSSETLGSYFTSLV